MRLGFDRVALIRISALDMSRPASLIYSPADPLVLALEVTRPDGTTFGAPTVTRDALGEYHATYTPDAVGVWTETWTSTTPNGSVTVQHHVD